jgi:hypothetical protein
LNTVTPSTSKDDLSKDYFGADRNGSRSATPTPAKPSRTGSVRPILGENTPPSATMLALQTMSVPKDIPDIPLPDVTNGGTTRSNQSFESISAQIVSLTNICTNLQREMAQLSRRSKDNATDLISLKEVASSRDEDIRKSLRDVMTTLHEKNATKQPDSGTPSSTTKAFSLPRIPSPSSLFDDMRCGSPNPYSVEGAASVAMLEKIIREMVTKEGQERLLSTLSTLFDKASKESGQTAKKVAELVEFIKTSPKSKALVPTNASVAFEPPKSSALTTTTRAVEPRIAMGYSDPDGGAKPYRSPKAADFVSDEIIKLLKKIKDSCGETASMMGRMNAEQRDLRGEVLGMGRRLGEKIDESRRAATGAKAIEDGSGKQDIARIVQEGLVELKSHLDNVMREKRRQSNSSVLSRSTVDSREVYDVVKHAIAQNQLVPAQAAYAGTQIVDKEAILNAVREAYEQYKPEFEIQQFGLERDEILQCLKEGLDQYHAKASSYASPQHGGNAISREEVFEAINDAMQTFHPPPPINDAHEIREEVLSAVRECLDEYKSMAPSGLTGSTLTESELNITREVVLDAVRAALATHGPGAPKELEISREDLFQAVKAGLESSGTPFGRYGEQVVHLINELVQDMREEFKSYSTASGRDTEQVLDAMKDGLESLRAEIEQYVDRAQDVTGKDEIIDTLRGGLDGLRRDIETYCAQGPASSHDLIKYLKSEFEHLHQALDGYSRSSGDRNVVMNTLRNGFESLRANIGNGSLDNDEVQEALKAEFEQLRDTILSGHDVHKNELMEAIQSGFARLHDRLEGGSSLLSDGSDSSIRAIKEELDHIRDTIASSMMNPTSSYDKDDVIDAIREKLDDMRTHIIAEQTDSAKEAQGAMREEFEHLRGVLGGTIVQSGGDDTKDEIIEAVRLTSDATAKTLLAEIQSEFDHLRNTVGSSIVRSGTDDQKDELLESIRNATESLEKAAERNGRGAMDNQLLEALRGEFEVIRNTIQSTGSRTASKADSEEILEVVRLGLDDMRSHMDRKMDNPERFNSLRSEMQDDFNEGLESLKTELSKQLDRPLDMTILYEMKDSLMKAVEELRRPRKDSMNGEQSLSRGDEIVLADGDESVTREIPVKPDSEKSTVADTEKLEFMLAQIQLKLDVVEENIQNPIFSSSQAPEESTVKTDLTSLESAIKDLQATITIVIGEKLDPDSMAKKEDTDAIETLLRNTKAKLDEMEFPDPTKAVTTERIEAMETLVKSTREAIDDLSNRIDESNASSKADLATVEAAVELVKAAVEKIDVQAKPVDADKEVSKTDVDAIGVLCLEIKEKLADINIPETNSLPSKTDVEQLTGLVHDFRDSHDKLKDSYEADISITAKAFEDRRREAIDIIESITAIKSGLGAIRDEFKSKVEDSATNVDKLKDTIKGLEDTIASNFSISGDVKELMEIVNREFERIHGSAEEAKMVQEQKATALEEKHDSVKENVIADICSKLDEKFDVIMSKYDDAQHAAESQIKAMEEKAVEQEKIMATTKEVADELKISLDTLGTTVTGMETSFQEITNKISGDSETVFARMEEGFDKLNDVHTHSSAQREHRLTREEIVKAVGHLETLQSEVTEYHPKFISRLEDILALVNRHFEQSQKAQEAAQEQAKAISEESRSLNEELKNALPGLLPLPAPPIETPSLVAKEHDDSQVYEKLDKLMEHITQSNNAFTQLERLDEIHQKVMATAAEVSQFVNTQTRLITEGHESKEKEAEEIALVLERRIAEKQHVEANILNLQTEKESLVTTINELRNEREALSTQKSRLEADVSALQTALDIRREELHHMDIRADALERRILDGIMTQSRALMLTKESKPPTSNSRKLRDISQASHSTISPLPPSNPASKGINLALRQRPSPIRRNGLNANTNPANRRILSLNQITHNTPTGAHGYAASSSIQDKSALLKRSQSVRSQGIRKASWSGSGKDGKRTTSTSSPFEEENKENTPTRSLQEIDESGAESEREEDMVSEAGTTVRTSLAGESEVGSSLAYATDTDTETESYMDSVTGESRRSSDAGTVMATESKVTGITESYLSGSGSETDMRMNYEITVQSTLGADTIVSEEAEEHEENDQERQQLVGEESDASAGAKPVVGVEVQQGQPAPAHTKDLVVYPAPSDSGFGSDMPTAAMSGSEMDYFRRAAEEEAA